MGYNGWRDWFYLCRGDSRIARCIRLNDGHGIRRCFVFRVGRGKYASGLLLPLWVNNIPFLYSIRWNMRVF